MNAIARHEMQRLEEQERYGNLVEHLREGEVLGRMDADDKDDLLTKIIQAAYSYEPGLTPHEQATQRMEKIESEIEGWVMHFANKECGV